MVLERLHKDDGGQWRGLAETLTLPARSLFVAAGTSPNTIYEKERPGTFKLDARGRFFQACDEQGAPARGGVFTSWRDGDRRVSFYGDNHPQFAGNVVKAMASARHGWPQVAELFRERVAALPPQEQPARDRARSELFARLDERCAPSSCASSA